MSRSESIIGRWYDCLEVKKETKKMKKNYYERKTRDAPPKILVAEHNWKQFIHELQRAGYSKANIAEVTGMSRERIDGILFKHTTPLWEHGDALLKFVYQLRKEKESAETETDSSISQELS